MPIQHAVVHRLQRSSDSEAKLTLRNSELPLDGDSEALLDQLKGGFLSRITREHGSFTREGETAPLVSMLESVLEDDDRFLATSGELCERLARGLDSGNIDFDAHLFFFLEKGAGGHHLLFFAARHNVALSIDDNLVVSPSYSLDSGSSLIGLKVDIEEWKTHENYAYLSLLPPRGAPLLNELLRSLTGFANGIDKQEATLSFLQGVEAYSRELPKEQANELRQQVVEYCIEQDQLDAPVDLRELSGELGGVLEEPQRQAFVRIVDEHRGDEGDGEELFRVDKRSLQRYVKLAGREKDLAISFSAYQLDERIRYDADNDTLSIKGIPKALRNQLLRHLEGGEE